MASSSPWMVEASYNRNARPGFASSSQKLEFLKHFILKDCQMKFDHISPAISSDEISRASRRASAIILELGIRENNEHVGSGLGGNNYQMLVMVQMQHHLVISDVPLALSANKNAMYWGMNAFLNLSLRDLRAEIDKVFKSIGNEFKIMSNVLNANVSNPIDYIDSLIGSTPGQDILTMVNNIMVGEKVDLYNLSYSNQIMIATLLCYKLANSLDHTGEDPRRRDVYIDNVGMALKDVEPEVFLITVRKCIQIDRIVRHNLDEHPSWSDTFAKITRMVY
jgi:hypothetical protein